MTQIIEDRWQMRRYITGAVAASVNEVLLQGEMGIELDTGYAKVGDGTTAYNSLPYITRGLSRVNTYGGTAYTIGFHDIGADVHCSNASAVTLTVPTNATTAFPIGTLIAFSQAGAGIVTAVGASGAVTVSGAFGTATTKLNDQRVLEKVGTDDWRVR